MGQRANYILIKGNRQQIYYNHWRANCIAKDLYLGEKRFLDFIRQCKPVDVMLDEVWIEGCVVINKDTHHLYFWSFELGYDSAVEYYLGQLNCKWPGWNISYVKNKMYDIERILVIDYLSRAEVFPVKVPDEKDFIIEETEDWICATVVIKTDSKIHTVQSANFNIESVLMFGWPVISLLLNKHATSLPREKDDYYKAVVIDDIDKKVIICESEFGLLEQVKHKWEGYELIMGDIGYIRALKLANIETDDLAMKPEEIEESFQGLISQTNDFDPKSFAKKLLKTTQDAQFNPNFFDTNKPVLTWAERMKRGWQNILNEIKSLPIIIRRLLIK